MPKSSVAAPADAAPMPELFTISENHPFFTAGNVYDGARELASYSRFLLQHAMLDEDDHELRTALWVLQDGAEKLSDALREYHDAFVAWTEARAAGGAQSLAAPYRKLSRNAIIEQANRGLRWDYRRE